MDKKEAIRYFGSLPAYNQQNDEALRAVRSLMQASEGYSVQAVANGALILAVATLRGCGASVEGVRALVVEAWDNELVRDMLRDLRRGKRA